MKKEYWTIPNLLSLSRGVFLPVLVILVLSERKIAFLIGYAILGSTDMLDGWIARKFNIKTQVGKTLDSAADILFYVGSAWFLYRLYPQYLMPNMNLLIAFFSLFATSFVISSIWCRKPIMMHTFLLRLNGLLVYLVIISSHFFDTTLFVGLILVIYLVGFTEEIIIFIRYGAVDPDTPSLLSLMRIQKKSVNKQ